MQCTDCCSCCLLICHWALNTIRNPEKREMMEKNEANYGRLWSVLKLSEKFVGLRESWSPQGFKQRMKHLKYVLSFNKLLDNELFKKWFHRTQPLQVEAMNTFNFPGSINCFYIYLKISTILLLGILLFISLLFVVAVLTMLIQ